MAAEADRRRLAESLLDTAAALEAAAKAEPSGWTFTPAAKGYNPDQPRDEHGRFGEGGGSDGETAGNASGAPAAPETPAPRAHEPKVFDSSDQIGMNQFANETSAAAYKQSTKYQKAAAQKYKGSGYQEMNKDLRDGNDPFHTKKDAELSKENRRRQKLINNSPLQEDVTVYRKLPNSVLPQSDSTGGILTDKGFCSTSLKSNFSWQGGARMEIRAYSGQAAFGMAAIAASHWDGECEMVLPFGSQFRVVSDNYSPGGSQRNIVCELINPPAGGGSDD